MPDKQPLEDDLNIIRLMREGDNIAQNIFIKLQDAVQVAGKGTFPSKEWEEVANYQTELLRKLAEIQRKAEEYARQRNQQASV